jgi:hypothetical protein
MFPNILAHAVVIVAALPVTVELDVPAPSVSVNLISFFSHSAV